MHVDVGNHSFTPGYELMERTMRVVGIHEISLIAICCLAILMAPSGTLLAGEKEDLYAAFEKAMALSKQANYPAAAVQYERALSLAPRVFGADAENTATILNNLANLYRNMHQYAKAEALYQRSLKIREAKLGVDHADVAASLNGLVLLYDEIGQYAKAEPLCQRCLKINEAKLGPDHPGVADSLNNLAVLYREMGQYAKAEPLYQRSLKIRDARLGVDHPNVAESLNNLATLYSKMGQYAKAEPLFQRSLKIKEAMLGSNHPALAPSLNNLATMYWEMGQYAKAELLYQRSLKFMDAALGPDHPDVAVVVEGLANLYRDTGQYAKAEALFERSLKIKEAALGADHPEVAISLNNLAIVYCRLGQYAEAESLFQRSLNIRETKLGADHPEVATSLNNLASLYKDMGQHTKAEPLYLRSLKIEEAKLGADHPDVANCLANLAGLYQALGSIEQAAEFCDRSRRVVRKHVGVVLPILSQNEQLTFLQQNDEAHYHMALTLGWRYRDEGVLVERTYDWPLNGKAVAQQSLAEQNLLARDSGDLKVSGMIRELNQARTELANLSRAVPKAGQEATYRRQLAERGQKVQELSREVNIAAGRSAREETWISTTAVRKALPADAVLVDIVRFEPKIFEAKHGEAHWQPALYVAWLVPPDGKGVVRVIDLGEAREVDALVESARQAIQQSGEKIQKPEDDEPPAEHAALAPLAKLAQRVLVPLKPYLAGARQLILSPDSNLWLVPWAALPIEDAKYAIERWQIRFATSGRDLVAGQQLSQLPRHKQNRPQIFADPDYDLDGKGTQAATRAVLRGQETQLALRSVVGRSATGLIKVDRLPGTAAEARLIIPWLESFVHQSPTVYSQQYALEGVLKLVASPKVLVLSTHGFYLPDQEVKPEDDERDGLREQASRGAVLAADGEPLENPLLRCGLLLAGCNQPQADSDDGVLTGMEIVGCDLRGTDIVVLSACETGVGQVRNGEGVAGLRQAFQLAGAKAVVSTLWRIPDAETASLMNDFFRNLAAGQNKAEALRNAQLALINSRRHETGAAHPLYWAAFTVTGD